MRKHFLLLMLMALLPMVGFAAELVGSTQYTNDGYQYKILSLDTNAKTGTVSVSQSNWTAKAADKTKISIPATITINLNGTVSSIAFNDQATFTVVEIEADGFKGLSDVTSIEFATGCQIATIGAGAFDGTKITDLDLKGTKITTLNKLFENNNVTLSTVELPATLTSLAANALANCIQLTGVDFSLCTDLATVGDGALSNTIVSEYNFSKCLALNFNTLDKPFVNSTTTTNKNLEKVTLPLNTTTNVCPVSVIGTVFANCEVLTEIVNLDKSLITTVGDKAFENDINLPSLVFPSALTTITNTPFKGCVKLASLEFKGNTAIGDGANPLFAEKTSGDGTLAALKTLKVTVVAETPKNTSSAIIKEKALNNLTGLTTIELAKDGIWGGTIEANAVKMAENENGSITFGDIASASFNSITGPVGVYTTALTMGAYTSAALTTSPIVTGTISKATITGAVAGTNILDAIGQAVEIDFQGDITAALSKPTNPNAVLTTLNFNAIKMATEPTIVTATFNETNAPLLTSVTWRPADADATAAFAQDAFGSASVGTNAKVTLHTTTAVGDGKYSLLESKLYNVIFDATAAAATPVEINVYGTSTSTYFYGKLTTASSQILAIDKETEDGDIVNVYSAFVDSKDQKIYMDPLALTNGQYIVADKQSVVVRLEVKNTATTAAGTGLKAVVKSYTSTGTPTMRYISGGSQIWNDLKTNPILFSSDYIGTNYVGKTLYAMANPAVVGVLQWAKVNKKSYLPANSLFVETVEQAASAPELEIVWLDGSDNVTGIIEKISQETKGNAAIYNLQGVRVNDMSKKGVYIQNGKKFVVK